MSFDLQLKNGDVSLKNGDLTLVRNSDKLIQDILKIATTPAGSNPYHAWYGSLISRTLIGQHLQDAIITSSAESQLRLALTTLQSLQNQQVRSGQTVTAEEQLGGILSIAVQRNTTNPTLFQVGIDVMNRAFRTVRPGFIVSPV